MAGFLFLFFVSLNSLYSEEEEVLSILVQEGMRWDPWERDPHCPSLSENRSLVHPDDSQLQFVEICSFWSWRSDRSASWRLYLSSCGLQPSQNLPWPSYSQLSGLSNPSLSHGVTSPCRWQPHDEPSWLEGIWGSSTLPTLRVSLFDIFFYSSLRFLHVSLCLLISLKNIPRTSHPLHTREET